MKAPDDTPDMVQAALELARRGLRVFPNKSRKPILEGWPDKATTDEAQIKTWFSGKRGLGVSVCLGTLSGVFVVDLDTPRPEKGKFENGLETMRALEAIHGPLPETYTVKTHSGGLHHFFKWPSGGGIGNSAGALGPGIDIKGARGAVVAPPSLGPNGRYEVVNDVEPAPAPSWLLDLLRKPKHAPRPPTAPVCLTGESTPYGLSALAAEADVVRLAPAGSRNDALNRSACALGGLVAGGELAYNDVENSLVRAAMDCGLTETEAVKTIASGLRAGMASPRKAPENGNPRQSKVSDTSGTCKTSVKSEEPCQIRVSDTSGTLTLDSEKFCSDAQISPGPPVDAFAPELGEVINASALSKKAPVEIAIASALALTSGLVGRSRGLRATPGEEPQHGNLWIVNSGRSGCAKTPVADEFFRPLERIQARNFASWRKAFDAYQEEKEARSRARKNEARGTKPEAPKLMQHVVDDVTLEALFDVLADNPRGILWNRDELSGLFLDLDKYTGSKGASKSRLLSCYDSKSIILNRKEKGKNLFIPSACVSIFGGIQPGILTEIFQTRDVLSGFLPRFIIINAEVKEIRTRSNNPLSNRQKSIIERLITNLASMTMHDDEPVNVVLTDEAYAYYESWFNDLAHENYLESNDATITLNEKLQTKALRLALLLYCQDEALKGKDAKGMVSLRVMERTIRLANWVKAHERQAWSAYLTGKATEKVAPFERKILESIIKLEHEISRGVISTARITEVVNEGIDPKHRVTVDVVGKALTRLKIPSKPDATGNHRVRVITDETLNRLRGIFPKQVPEVSTYQKPTNDGPSQSDTLKNQVPEVSDDFPEEPAGIYDDIPPITDADAFLVGDDTDEIPPMEVDI